ncbi:hypothetical protein JCM4814A_50930 [Streptomyces phaeofaciens JCM 4814]|uniref:Uncharacterized protein n=1 Tax=Streptomyces phaeofaciens TaxID=68254 RepID=A0A918M053_9ACTN|nr:hypothetical protein GCM10010226_78070 [Streptomyces phaeofaciens]
MEGTRVPAAWSPGRTACPAVDVGREAGGTGCEARGAGCEARGAVWGARVVGRGAGASVGEGGRAVLEVSGSAVAEGSGGSEGVGKDRSLEADGAGRGVPSSDAVSAQMPTPPATRTAAPPTIHGVLRGGLR